MQVEGRELAIRRVGVYQENKQGEVQGEVQGEAIRAACRAAAGQKMDSKR